MSTSKQVKWNERLKLLRQRMDKSQAEMAGLLHISLRGYQNYERGEREVPVVTLERARDHFGLNPAWVLDGVGEMFVSVPEGGPEAARIAKMLGLAAPTLGFDAPLMRAVIEAALKLVKWKDPPRFAELCLVAYEMERGAAKPDAEGRVRQLLRLAG